jgi:hypothetical protein
MKRLTYSLLLSLFLYPSVYIYGQEEFFGNQNGLSLSYLNGLSLSYPEGLNFLASAVGFSTYIKSGIVIGMGLEKVDDEIFPLANIIIYPDLGTSQIHLKSCFGVSYAFAKNHHLVGLNMGLIKCFFPESDFPFSINGSFSAQTGFANNKEIGLNIIPVIGFGFTQAFFAHHKLYPLIGFSKTYELDTKSNLFSVIIGINMKLGSTQRKTNQLMR